MVDLLSPLTIGGCELPNRIATAPAPCGGVAGDGFVSETVIGDYERRACRGAGLVITEALRVTPPIGDLRNPHLGIYADAFVPGLERLVRAIHARGARVMLTLDEPIAPAPAADLAPFGEAFIQAAWRAHCAGADGVMLTAADGGALHTLLSPLRNQRVDAYGRGGSGRQRLALEVVEGVRQWLGRRLIVGFRLLAEEFSPGGLTLQDARVLAKRLTAAGVGLIDVPAPQAPPSVARFPGWAIPLASSIRRVVEVPVIGSGDLYDRDLAASLVRDESVDLVVLDPGPQLERR